MPKSGFLDRTIAITIEEKDSGIGETDVREGVTRNYRYLRREPFVVLYNIIGKPENSKNGIL